MDLNKDYCGSGLASRLASDGILQLMQFDILRSGNGSQRLQSTVSGPTTWTIRTQGAHQGRDDQILVAFGGCIDLDNDACQTAGCTARAKHRTKSLREIRRFTSSWKTSNYTPSSAPCIGRSPGGTHLVQTAYGTIDPFPESKQKAHGRVGFLTAAQRFVVLA